MTCSASRVSHVPTVFSFHTLYGEFVKQYKGLKPLSTLLWWLMREYHNRADLNLTVSGSHAGRTGPARISPRRVVAARGGQRPVPPQPRELRDAGPPVGRPPRAAALLTVSRLAPEKNVGFLADVM